jgi:hypothetical protein
MSVTVDQDLEFVASGAQPLTVRVRLKRAWEKQPKQPFPMVPTGTPCLGAFANPDTRQWIDVWALPRNFDANPFDVATAGVVSMESAIMAAQTIDNQGQSEGWIQFLPADSPSEQWQVILCRTTENHLVFARYEGGSDPTSADALFEMFEATPVSQGSLEGHASIGGGGAWGCCLPASWVGESPLDESRTWYSPIGDSAALGISLSHVARSAQPTGEVLRSALAFSDRHVLQYLGAPLVTPPPDSRFESRTFFHTTGTLNEAPVEIAVMLHEVEESFLLLTGITPEMTIDSTDWTRGKKAFQIACETLSHTPA